MYKTFCDHCGNELDPGITRPSVEIRLSHTTGSTMQMPHFCEPCGLMLRAWLAEFCKGVKIK